MDRDAFLRMKLVLKAGEYNSRIKAVKLKDASDIARTLSSFASLKELIYRSFPGIDELISVEYYLMESGKLSMIILENDEDMDAVDLARIRYVTLHIYVSRIPESIGRLRSSNDALSVPVATRGEQPGETQEEKSGERQGGKPREKHKETSNGLAPTCHKTKPCVHFRSGYCRKGEACTFLHDGPSWQSRDTARTGSKIKQNTGSYREQSWSNGQAAARTAVGAKRRLSGEEPAGCNVGGYDDPAPNRQKEDSELGLYPLYLANRAMKRSSGEFAQVVNQYTREVEAEVPLASAEDLESATQAAVKSFSEMAAFPSYKRKAILQHVAEELQRRSEEMAKSITVESGKAIWGSRLEVLRSIQTFEAAAEESTRIYGEHLNFDATPRSNGTQGIVRKLPIGPVSLISPRNFSLTFLAQKVASALAVGCTFVLQPHSRALLPALTLGEILESCKELPRGSFSILPMSAEVAYEFKYDERFKLFASAGSGEAERGERRGARQHKIVVEGGRSVVCVVEDLVPDLQGTLTRLMTGAYFQGQLACYVRESLYEEMKNGLLDAVSKLKVGDPFLDETDVGPMITESAAEGVEGWINDVVKKGGRCLVGGKRYGAFVEPSILENVLHDAEVAGDWSEEEMLGPVLLLYSYRDFKEAVAKINDTHSKFEAGIFSSDITKAFYAFENLASGGQVWNDCPSSRLSCQPHGGLAGSGLQREDLRHEMEDMLERKVFVMHNPGVV